MSQQELLGRVVAALLDADIEYMITGSIASSLQGEPRSTHDIDVVVELASSGPESVNRLLAAFPPPDFFLDESAIRSAIDTAGMFNLIDVREGDKADFWLLTTDAFDQSRFKRRYVERLDDLEIHVSTPEDTILMKLKWARDSGGSEKQFTDALRVYELQYALLDHAYLDQWAQSLGITVLLDRLISDAEPL